jgi:hypothetical protein
MYKYLKVMTPALALCLQMSYAQSQAQADPAAETVKTETTTQGTPEVVKSYMVPTLNQTKETTDSSGETTKTTAPMIMERHEQVVVPQENTTTETTIENKPTVVEETIEQKSTQKVKPAIKKTSYTRAVTVPKRHIAHHVVHHHTGPIAQTTNENSTIVKRTVVDQPTVVQHTEQTVSDPVTYERKDPSLGN